MLNLHNTKREFDYWLKAKLSLSPPLFKLKKPNFDDLQARFSTAQKQRFDELQSKFDLNQWCQVCSASELWGNLCILDILDRHLSPLRPNGPALDIGSRNFWYAPALHSFLPENWTGVEVDAHQRYWTGHTRRTVRRLLGRP